MAALGGKARLDAHSFFDWSHHLRGGSVAALGGKARLDINRLAEAEPFCNLDCRGGPRVLFLGLNSPALRMLCFPWRRGLFRCGRLRWDPCCLMYWEEGSWHSNHL